jgi:hypothetical protein
VRSVASGGHGRFPNVVSQDGLISQPKYMKHIKRTVHFQVQKGVRQLKSRRLLSQHVRTNPRLENFPCPIVGRLDDLPFPWLEDAAYYWWAHFHGSDSLSHQTLMRPRVGGEPRRQLWVALWELSAGVPYGLAAPPKFLPEMRGSRKDVKIMSGSYRRRADLG